jgi:hypothetical protein
MLNGEETGYTFPMQSGSAVPHPAIEKLFGRAMIGEMMFRWVRGTPAERKDLKEEIVDAALRYQLVSRFTSRVAVEQRVKRGPDGTLVTVPVRAPLPRGWNPAAFFPTATNDWALLAAGLVLMLGGAGAALCRCRATPGGGHVR